MMQTIHPDILHHIAQYVMVDVDEDDDTMNDPDTIDIESINICHLRNMLCVCKTWRNAFVHGEGGGRAMLRGFKWDCENKIPLGWIVRYGTVFITYLDTPNVDICKVARHFQYLVNLQTLDVTIHTWRATLARHFPKDNMHALAQLETHCTVIRSLHIRFTTPYSREWQTYTKKRVVYHGTSNACFEAIFSMLPKTLHDLTLDNWSSYFPLALQMSTFPQGRYTTLTRLTFMRILPDIPNNIALLFPALVSIYGATYWFGETQSLYASAPYIKTMKCKIYPTTLTNEGDDSLRQLSVLSHVHRLELKWYDYEHSNQNKGTLILDSLTSLLHLRELRASGFEWEDSVKRLASLTRLTCLEVQKVYTPCLAQNICQLTQLRTLCLYYIKNIWQDASWRRHLTKLVFLETLRIDDIYPRIDATCIRETWAPPILFLKSKRLTKWYVPNCVCNLVCELVPELAVIVKNLWEA